MPQQKSEVVIDDKKLSVELYVNSNGNDLFNKYSGNFSLAPW